MRYRKKRFMFATMVLIGFFSMPARSEECSKVIVHYHERMPYAVTGEEGAEGLTAGPAQIAFEKAGIAFEWENTPSKRQMQLVEAMTGCDCALGWFKNPEREQFAKFTAYIYQDKPQIAIARADHQWLHQGLHLEKLFKHADLTMGAKDGYSYGRVLDEMIARYRPRVEKTTAGNTQMLKMLHLKRIDYFFLAPEEADELIASSGLPKEDFQFINFVDMPEGEKRYIMCSRRISDDIILKLNTAIKKYVHNQRPLRTNR